MAFDPAEWTVDQLAELVLEEAVWTGVVALPSSMGKPLEKKPAPDARMVAKRMPKRALDNFLRSKPMDTEGIIAQFNASGHREEIKAYFAAAYRAKRAAVDRAQELVRQQHEDRGYFEMMLEVVNDMYA